MVAPEHGADQGRWRNTPTCWSGRATWKRNASRWSDRSTPSRTSCSASHASTRRRAISLSRQKCRQLNTKIAELEIQRSGLLQEFQPSAPEVKILEEQIAQAKREREQILARAVDQQFLTLAKQEAVNPVYQDLLKGLLEAQSNLQAVEASLAVVGRQQAQFEQLFRQTPDTMAEYTAPDAAVLTLR
jgi:uncharacterized protein involved in exopolysaccharide biosynthesis